MSEATVTEARGTDPAKITRPILALGIALICALIPLIFEIKALMVIPMIPTFISDVGFTPVETSWVLFIGSLVGLSITGVLSRLGDIYGHKKILLVVLCCQLVGDALIVFSGANPGLVIAGRAVAGISVAAPLINAIMRDAFNDRVMRFGVSIVAGVSGVGVGIAFLFSGVFLALGLSWRDVFIMCAALTVLALVLVSIWVPESTTRDRVRVDYLGAVGLAVWAGALVTALTMMNSWGGAASPWFIGLLTLSVITFVLWVSYQRRISNPVLNVRIAFGRRVLPVLFIAAITGMSSYVVYIGVSTFVQADPSSAGYGFSLSVLQSALVLLPMAIIFGVGSLLAGRLIGNLGARPLLVLGSVIMAVPFAWWYFDRSSVWTFLIGAALWGFGVCFLWVGQYMVATVEAPTGQAASMNAAVVIFSALGGTLGPALVTMFTTAEYVPNTYYSVEAGWQHTFLFGIIVMAISTAISLALPRGVGSTLPRATAPEHRDPREAPSSEWTAA